MRDDAFSRCHPILNFFYFAVVLGFTMFVQHPVFLGISFLAATCYAIWLSGLRRTMKMNFLFTIPGLLIVALLNPMLNHYGVTPLLYIESSGNWVTLEALVYGVVLGCVLFIVIEWFTCYNHIMTSDKFLYLFGKVIPALSLILSMALRLVPRFGKELTVIRNGQKCVGRDISSGSLFRRLRYGLDIISTLVTWALENAIETADSMKSRGYGLHGRTAFSIYRFDKRDKAIGTVLLVLFLIFFYGCIQGAGFARYNPRILLAGFIIQQREAPVTCPPFLSWITYLCFGVFCFTPLGLDMVEEIAMRQSRKHIGRDPVLTYRKIYEEMETEA